MPDTKIHTLEDRVAVLVNDVSNLIYSTVAIDEGMRVALSWINLKLGQAYKIEGLDAAVVTSLPAELDSTIVQGAAGFMLSGQVAALVLGANIAPGASAAMAGWVKMQQALFFQTLDMLRLQALQKSADVPYSAVVWDENDSDAGLG